VKRLSVFLIFFFVSSQFIAAGSFNIHSNISGDVNGIIHPFLYVGVGGTVTVRVCLDPNLTDRTLAEPSVVKAISAWNNLVHLKPNLSIDVPIGEFDFESVLLHEIGHCAFGLLHPDLGSLIPSPIDRFATIALVGDDGLFSIGVGADGAPGSSDDFRDDDVNYMWFNKFDNNPFFLSGTIDTTTYSREIEDLPAGHSFAANANRLVGPVSTPVVNGTEAVMTSVVLADEGRRKLQADDVAIVELGKSGKDGIAGTADDYTVHLTYAGRDTDPANCDVIIETNSEPGANLGLCLVESVSIGSSHFRLAGNGIIQIQERDDWYYRFEVFSEGFENGDFSGWSSTFP
jgi:hypothetical protein